MEHEHAFTSNTNPALVAQKWVGLENPLSQFTGLTTRSPLVQMVISADYPRVYACNVYFYATTADVEDLPGAVPSTYSLGQNHPNPFNPSIKITLKS